MTALAPVLITVVLSLLLGHIMPNLVVTVGMLLALVASYFMAE